jgi:hypothetical protein
VACDETCTLLLSVLNTENKVFFWDTESVTYLTVLGTNEQRCSLVQVYSILKVGHVTLQCPGLEGRGLPTLRAKLRSTAPEAPRSIGNGN